MADTQVLGTCVFGRAGSSPASRTQLLIRPQAISRQNYAPVCITVRKFPLVDQYPTMEINSHNRASLKFEN